jgi:uncharacterized membrane protein
MVLFDKNSANETTRFHVKQAINLFLFSLVANIALGVMSIMTVGLLAFLGLLLQLAFVALWVMGLVNAINQKKAEVPVIGKFAEQYLTF